MEVFENEAAKKYLQDSKKDLDPEKFTRAYVKRHLRHIYDYCMHDALLTARLGTYFVSKLHEFGFEASSLYSGATLSFGYYLRNAKIIDVWRFWKYRPELLAFAMDAYAGGKFEITSRGYFRRLYEYDITSAYPHEISNLVDISDAKVVRDRRYHADAQYAFLRVLIRSTGESYLPCGPMLDNLRIYPSGSFYMTITKEEYEYMRELPGVKIRIIEVQSLFVEKQRFPYRKLTLKLFELKDYYKTRDITLSNVAKVMANSFYGKMVQVIDDYKGNANAGQGFNPMYGAIITANTRIKVTKMQNRFKEKCVAVHTDSVMLTCPLPESECSKALGEFSFVDSGEAVIIACGQYSLGEASAFKGFDPIDGDTWKSILSRNLRRRIIQYPYRKVESWVEAVSKKHYDKINLFTEETKQIDLNAEQKRLWPSEVTTGFLLKKHQRSSAHVWIEKNPPEHWKNF